MMNEQVAEWRKEEIHQASSVIVGNESWRGFDQEYKTVMPFHSEF